MIALGRTIFQIWGWVGIGLYLFLAWRMAVLLVSPGPTDGPVILTFGVLMGFEFILVHSGVFMAVTPRWLSLTLLVPLYALFAWAMNSLIPGNAVLWLYLSVTLTRMRFAFSKPSDEAKVANTLFSISAVMTYFVLIFVFAFSSGFLPRFGITHEYLQSINYADLHDSGGIFIDLPHVPLSMGVVYFTLLAIYEWSIHVRRQKQPFS